MSASKPADALVPAGHLFTGVDYVPISAEELELKTKRIQRALGLAWTELLEVCDRREWKADQKYKSFHDYCMQNFEFSGRSGYQKAAAQRVNNVLIEHGQPPIKERLAREVHDLAPAKILEVLETGRNLSDQRHKTGMAARFHSPGKLSSRVVAEARALIVPEAPKAPGAPLIPPVKPKSPLTKEPLELPVTPYHVTTDLARFGKVYHIEIEGRKYYLHVRASDFAEFFPSAAEDSDPFAAN